MFQCPRCKFELPAEAFFCTRCGFNHTNASMKAAAAKQPTQGKNLPPKQTPLATPPVPRTIQPEVKRTPPAASAFNEALRSAQPAEPRTIQPEVKRTPSVSSAFNEALRVPETPQPPAKVNAPQPTIPQSKQHGTGQQEQARQRESNALPVKDALEPVKTNTPPKRVTNPSIPTRPGAKMPAQSAQSVTFPPAIPATPTPPRVSALKPVNTASVQPPTVQPPSTPLPEKGMSLTQRYMADQQAPGLQAPQPVVRPQPAPQQLPPAQAKPSKPAGMPWGLNSSMQPSPMTPPAQPQAGTPAGVYQHAEAARWDIGWPGPSEQPLSSSESLVATSKAVEHWRKSWRDRQHAEAGPAVGVSRGQASVAEPLLAMQHSFVRMRAILLSGAKGQKRGRNLGFWLTILLMISLIGGLMAYIASTYAPGTNPATPIASANDAPPAILTIPGGKPGTVIAGQTLHVHGENFGAHDTIIFKLDTTPITAATGKTVGTTGHGTFDASFAFAHTWLVGAYALQAQDTHTGQHALLDVQVLPATMANTTSLQFSLQQQPIQDLSFTGATGEKDPDGQWVGLTNTSDTEPITWSAAVITENNLNWLMIDNHKTTGRLEIQGNDTLGISIQTAGLESSKTPYKGYVIFTLDNNMQAILPVSLLVQNEAIEVVINPNPVIAALQPAARGTCQPLSLTLINLSDQPVVWNANPYTDDQNYVHLDGKPTDQGTLNPSGIAGDTVVVPITCINVHAGQVLHITVSYNINDGGSSQTISMFVHTSY